LRVSFPSPHPLPPRLSLSLSDSGLFYGSNDECLRRVEKEHEEELRMTVEQILRMDVKQTLSPHDQYLGAKARIQALVRAHLDQRDSHARAWWQLNSHLVSVLSMLHAAPLLKLCTARTQASRLWTECTHLMPH